MKTYFFALLIIITGINTPLLKAAESSSPFEKTISLADGTQLQLNGSGTRRVWFIPIYHAALYLPEKTQTLEAIFTLPGTKRIQMNFVYKKVSRSKMLATLDKGFKDNHTPTELDVITNEISQLKALFKTVYKGDQVILDYIPTVGTQLFFNDELQGIIPGEEFHRAALRVWLGEKPADKKLKKQLLGQLN